MSETNPILLGTTTTYKRALDAIKSNKDYTKGAIDEYFQTFTENLEEFRISSIDGEFDDKVIENIDKFLPFRSEAIEVFLAIAQYRNTPEAWYQIHKFFENLIPYMDRPEGVSTRRESDFDNFKFIIHELFLYAISSLLKYECFDAVAHLIRHHYYVEKNAAYGRDVMVPYTIFRNYLNSLEHRNKRLNLRRLSLRADLLEQRSKTSGIAFGKIMQSDFILFIKACFDSINNKAYQSWWPETLLYIERHSGTFEIFARSQSKEYFDRIKCIFDIGDEKDFIPLFEAFGENKLSLPRWQFTTLNPEILLGFEGLATKP